MSLNLFYLGEGCFEKDASRFWVTLHNMGFFWLRCQVRGILIPLNSFGTYTRSHLAFHLGGANHKKSGTMCLFIYSFFWGVRGFGLRNMPQGQGLALSLFWHTIWVGQRTTISLSSVCLFWGRLLSEIHFNVKGLASSHFDMLFGWGIPQWKRNCPSIFLFRKLLSETCLDVGGYII